MAVCYLSNLYLYMVIEFENLGYKVTILQPASGSRQMGQTCLSWHIERLPKNTLQ